MSDETAKPPEAGAGADPGGGARSAGRASGAEGRARAALLARVEGAEAHLRWVQQLALLAAAVALVAAVMALVLYVRARGGLPGVPAAS